MSPDQKRIMRQASRSSIADLWRALQPLKSTIRFLNTGAHPDDETTGMLARLALKDGIRIGYACANRGEGGQNALGSETGARLGALRTREMEKACEFLDIDMYWLAQHPADTIYDFRLSKTAEETFKYWNKERTIERMVSIIRQFRPDIITPTFLDVPGQHGHHRAMTQAAETAWHMAADPTAFPEQIENGYDVWETSKYYLPAWSGAGLAYDDTEKPPRQSLEIDVSELDPVFGATYPQIGQWSRVFHQTQGMGEWIDPSAKSWPLHLKLLRNGTPGDEQAVTDGLPATMSDFASTINNPTARADVNQAAKHIDAALDAFPDRSTISNELVLALELIRKAQSLLSEIDRTRSFRLGRKDQEISRALYITANIQSRIDMPNSSIARGNNLVVGVKTHSPGTSEILSTSLTILDQTQDAGTTGDQLSLEIPTNAKLADGYRDHFDMLSQDQCPLSAHITFRFNKTEITHLIKPEADLTILPGITAEPVTRSIFRNTAKDKTNFTVSFLLRNQSENPVLASFTLDVDQGWKVQPEQIQVKFNASQNPEKITFECTPPAGVNNRTGARLSINGNDCSLGHIHHMMYPHTDLVTLIEPPQMLLQSSSIKTSPDVKTGYIGGGADIIPDALQALDLSCTRLTDEDLLVVDFGQFDTIVIGVFAFRLRPILATLRDKLHTFVQSGGNLVTFYHRPWDSWDTHHTPLARLEIGTPSLRFRVTDQNADVTHLQSDHPILNTPNMIDEESWNHWVKERGLYFAKSWDGAYTPLLSMADPDEQPHEGSLLSGQFGKGLHTHVALALHTQLANLVPGAFQLLANILTPPQGHN